MADHDGKSSEFKTKKAKVVDRFVFLLLLLGAIAMVFPLRTSALFRIRGSLANMQRCFRNRSF